MVETTPVKITVYLSVVSAPTPVVVTLDLSSRTLWSYHRRSDQPALATRPGAHRVQSNILTFKVLHASAQSYLGPVTRITDLPGRRVLRSSGRKSLVVPRYRLPTVCSRSFPVAAACSHLEFAAWQRRPSQQRVFRHFNLIWKLSYFIDLFALAL